LSVTAGRYSAYLRPSGQPCYSPSRIWSSKLVAACSLDMGTYSTPEVIGLLILIIDTRRFFCVTAKLLPILLLVRLANRWLPEGENSSFTNALPAVLRVATAFRKSLRVNVWVGSTRTSTPF